MEYVKHPLIKEKTLEERAYQDSVLQKARKDNLLCILPTGLGKTPISVLLTADRLEAFPDSKILVMAPTKPLAGQHYDTFLKFLRIPEDKLHVVTGTVNPSERENLYREKQVIFATPQTIQNDLKAGRLYMGPFSLLVIDEIHHAVGRYAYPYVSQVYMKEAENPRILGLTASPGTSMEKIKEVCNNCGIGLIEAKTEEDKDVQPYVKEKRMEWISVELPPSFLNILQYLNKAYRKRVDSLRRMKFLRGSRATKKQLLELQANLIKAIREGYKRAFMGIRHTTQAIKLEHAIGLLETQSVPALEKYFKKLREDPKAEPLLKDSDVSYSMELTQKLYRNGSKHPKMGVLCTIIDNYLTRKPQAKIIVFANYRDTVKEVAGVLESVGSAHPVEFVGQKEGITQKEQAKRLADFRAGYHNILVCTSIGEEGLDIPTMDLAIFYEPVPSAIRSIQRRGRVGRDRFGRIIILLAKKTRDEAYYWSAKNKEKAMQRTLKKMGSS